MCNTSFRSYSVLLAKHFHVYRQIQQNSKYWLSVLSISIWIKVKRAAKLCAWSHVNSIDRNEKGPSLPCCKCIKLAILTRLPCYAMYIWFQFKVCLSIGLNFFCFCFGLNCSEWIDKIGAIDTNGKPQQGRWGGEES